MAIKWRFPIPPSLKALTDGKRPPGSGVFDGADLRGLLGRAAGCGPDQFRPARWRLSELGDHLGRSGRLCAAVRARPALPRLELQLSDRSRDRRHVLAQE